MQVREILSRDPSREITSVVKITDHDPRRVWVEMDEYVPTETVKQYFRKILDALTETHRGATENVCIWVSGFFGSGKSHFLKVLGYLLENRPLQDPDGHEHSSSEFLCRKLGLEHFLPLLTKELRVKVLFVNLLDYDPQSPERPTISRLIYRNLLEQKGLATESWVAEWEKEFQRLGKWEPFQEWVQSNFGRRWEEERRLNAEVVLRRALPALLPERYRSEEEANSAIQGSKRRFSALTPSEVVTELLQEAQALHPQNGRIVVLLDEVGLYIGDSVERLTDLNALAEQVVQQGDGKILLIATAQEALTDLVPRLTADRQILGWLQDRFKIRLGLPPTDVKEVVASRLLEKTAEGAQLLRELYHCYQGALHENLTLGRDWGEGEFVAHYPLHPYAAELMQDIMGAMRGSIEDARRLSGSQRSMLNLVQSILVGSGGIVQGAAQEVGWLVSLDLFYDALKPDLSVVRSEQIQVIDDLERLGEVDGLPLGRLAKALVLLQHLRQRTCTVKNLASALVDRVDANLHGLQEAVRKGLQRLQEEGWVAEEEGQYRLLTRAEYDLERDVRANYPTPAEIREGAVEILRNMLQKFRYEHGQIRRPLEVAIVADGQAIKNGELKVEFFTPFAEETEEDLLGRSIAEQRTIFWKAADHAELRRTLERALAIRKTLEQWRTLTLSPQQEEYKHRLEREEQTYWQTRLPEITKEALFNGCLFLQGSKQSPPNTNRDMEAVLRQLLQNLAQEVYTEFVDARPARDDDCAEILKWQPSTALPEIYTRLNLLTPANQINHDAGLLATVKAELQRRQSSGERTTGRDLEEHFEKPPYGWDPRLVRLLVATLFKAGIAGVQYLNRDFFDPTDPQVRSVFVRDREFGRAIFTLRPQVDWREASEKCSSVFDVPGGDTFERTVSIIREQATLWSQKAQQVSVRCRDNRLPPHLAQDCEAVAQTLEEIARLTEPIACLRRFLDHAELLSQKMPIVRKLEQFPFEQWRTVQDFVQTVSDWADTLTDEAARRWQRLCSNVNAPDLLDRWEQIRQDYAFLLSRYRPDYAQRHRTSQQELTAILKDLRRHPAFEHNPQKAEEALQPLKGRVCAEQPEQGEGNYRCARCHRSFAELDPARLTDLRRQVERVLDALMPQPPTEEPVEPLRLERIVSQEADVDAIASELHRYLRRAARPIKVRLEAEVAGE